MLPTLSMYPCVGNGAAVTKHISLIEPQSSLLSVHACHHSVRDQTLHLSLWNWCWRDVIATHQAYRASAYFKTPRSTVFRETLWRASTMMRKHLTVLIRNIASFTVFDGGVDWIISSRWGEVMQDVERKAQWRAYIRLSWITVIPDIKMHL